MKFNNFLILFFIFNHTSYVVINLCLYLGLLQFCGLLLLVSRLLLFPIFLILILSLLLFFYIDSFVWRRKWKPSPVFLPGESYGQRNLEGCCPWGRTELDMTEET